ncbi:hypothetical protein ANCCAN_02794 [Ancylostoma caninum]|uniref:Glutamine amidotransferase type-2 domain-containing protein n=1 Tax=Ancylostoma caninum TaxID=29170 RepID=A0A368H6V8_ANCCA|nr:hypothetical protein ANCCAN_02794 [Ancylostoma caninum]
MVILSKEQLEVAEKEGLWLPQLERDGCGVGFVVSIKGVKTHKLPPSSLIMCASKWERLTKTFNGVVSIGI